LLWRGSLCASILFCTSHAAFPQLGAVTYDVAQTAIADHLLIDVAPSTVEVAAPPAGAKVEIEAIAAL
jgi:enamine deaminase RidA (YjgF/YER057c/UK114 family)